MQGRGVVNWGWVVGQRLDGEGEVRNEEVVREVCWW